MVDPIESVTADERRRALEAMLAAPEAQRVLDEPVLSTLGAAAVEPPGERFVGEDDALAALVDDCSSGFAFAERVLCEAAVEIWTTACTGTRASRTALLRGLGAFLLNDMANRSVLEKREALAIE